MERLQLHVQELESKIQGKEKVAKPTTPFCCGSWAADFCELLNEYEPEVRHS